MPQPSQSTALATTETPAAPKSSLRRRLRSAGVVAIAAAFVGSVALPAVALQPQTPADDSYLGVGTEAQVIQVETSAGTQEIDLPALQGVLTQDEIDEINAAAAEEQRIQEEAAAEAAAAEDAEAVETTQGADVTAETPEAPVDVPASAAGGDVVSIAVSKLGSPYVFGATGPSAFDCSGFTQWVFAQVGVALPRDATSQASVGTPVSSPEPGDLLVWNGHVAIYVGNDTIIHAATPSSGVKYSAYSAMLGAFGTPQIRRF